MEIRPNMEQFIGYGAYTNQLVRDGLFDRQVVVRPVAIRQAQIRTIEFLEIPEPVRQLLVGSGAWQPQELARFTFDLLVRQPDASASGVIMTLYPEELALADFFDFNGLMTDREGFMTIDGGGRWELLPTNAGTRHVHLGHPLIPKAPQDEKYGYLISKVAGVRSSFQSLKAAGRI